MSQLKDRWAERTSPFSLSLLFYLGLPGIESGRTTVGWLEEGDLYLLY